MHIYILLSVFILANTSFLYAAEGINSELASDEDALNLFCLQKAYPQIVKLTKTADGSKWLEFVDGDKVLYQNSPVSNTFNDGLEADVYTTMEQRYPLEPARVETPPGFAPGRKRSYELFKKLYGNDVAEVKRNLVKIKFLKKNIQLTGDAGQAFLRIASELENLAGINKRFSELLKPEGGFYWRKIAGEKELSAHSFGIALDIGVDKSPYWRWSRERPHPFQKSYPHQIVELMENQGFIWGGKWHEYDLMHFEYRPELVCKSKILAKQSAGK